MKKNFKIISLSILILIQLILFQYLLRVEPSILGWEITNLYFVIIITFSLTLSALLKMISKQYPKHILGVNFIIAFIVILLIYRTIGIYVISIFNEGTTFKFSVVALVSMTLYYYIQKAKSGEEIYLRPIAGLKAIEEAVGRATEMGKSVLFVPGISDLDQVETVSGLILLGHVAETTARYEAGLNVPVSKSIVMEAARETCRESYLRAGRPDLYYDDMVHYLTDDQFAYAAGVNGIMVREKPAACFYLGKFYAESLILAETGNSIGAIQIAGTGSPSQIPFFVTACDYTLIGEEFFTASAYLSKKPELLGSIKGQDIVKGLIMITMVLTVILHGFFQAGWIEFDIVTLFGH